MLEILRDIGRPTLSNIGADAAQAVSILALHDSLAVVRSVFAISSEFIAFIISPVPGRRQQCPMPTGSHEARRALSCPQAAAELPT
jgi:hypothetical protein